MISIKSWSSFYQTYLVIFFFICIFLTATLSEGTFLFLAKFVLLPLISIILYRTESFIFLLIPIVVFQYSVGPYVNGYQTFLFIFFIPFYFVKLFSYKSIFSVHTTFWYFFSFLYVTIYLLSCIDIISSSITYLTTVIVAASSLFLYSRLLCDQKHSYFLFLIILLTSVLCISGFTFDIIENSFNSLNILTIPESAGIGVHDRNYASLVSSFGFAILLGFRVSKYKLIKFLLFLVLIIGVIKSGSRSGLIAFFLIFLLHRLFSSKQKRVVKYFSLILTGIIVLTILLIIFPVLTESNIVTDRWTDTFKDFNTDSYDSLSSNRTIIWGLYMAYFFSQNLFNFLFGFNNISDANFFDLVGDGMVTHSLYIDSLLAFGLVGTVFLFFSYFINLKNTLKLYRMSLNDSYLIVFLFKVSALIMGITLALVRVDIWWFVFFI